MMIFCFILALSISMITVVMGMKLLIKGCKKGEVFCQKTVMWTAYLVIISGLFTAALSVGLGIKMLVQKQDGRGYSMMMGDRMPRNMNPRDR